MDKMVKKFMKVIRMGYCCKCGKCCIGCEFLLKNNLCSVYKNRPNKCVKNFPHTNHILPEGCTYSFVLEDDGEEELTFGEVND